MNTDNFSRWNEYQSKYIDLKQKFINISTSRISPNSLIKLKTHFYNSINSMRDLDNIKDFIDLLTVLENRAILCYNKIQPLKYIASEIVNDPILDRIIHEYEVSTKNQKVLPLFNVYESRLSTTLKSLTVTKPGEKYSCEFNSVEQKKVFERLSGDLGRYWRDLARLLDVTESEIDEIDHNINLQLSDKALKAFEIFSKRCQTITWKSKLIQALKIVRRRDLIEVLDKLLNSSNS